jgi:hypothetical protein
MGAIGEGQALMFRVNRNCPWNRCSFCRVYKNRQFSTRSIEEIRNDIDTVRRIKDLLETAKMDTGIEGLSARDTLGRVIANHPHIYGRYPLDCTHQQWRAVNSLCNVANWLTHGGKRVFLQDANPLAMKPSVLVDVLNDLKRAFPAIDTVTCYARSGTFARRSIEELTRLKEAGLTWCYVGIESGCNKILKYMKKGVTMARHITGGRRAMDAGLQVAAFVMPGLAGAGMGEAKAHIADTVAVLNEIQPTEVRVRSLSLLEGAPLYKEWKSGRFKPADEDQMIEEIGMLIQGLTFDCTFETLQMTNPLFNIKDRLFRRKSEMLETIDRYKALPSLEKARYLLRTYVDGGYVDIIKSRGKYDTALQSLIEGASEAVRANHADAEEKAKHVIFSIKSRLVP